MERRRCRRHARTRVRRAVAQARQEHHMWPAPPVPAPVSVAAPAPRVVPVAQMPAGLRVLARDWEDKHPATYTIEALHGRHWQPATGEETTQATWLLAAHVDRLNRQEP